MSEEVKTIKLVKVYSMRLISMLDLKPHDIAFSLDAEKLTKLHNSNHVDDPYKIGGYPNFSFTYKEGTPFQWYIEPAKELIEKRLAGIIENWIDENELKELKNKIYFIE